MIRLIDKLLACDRWERNTSAARISESDWRKTCGDYYSRLVKARVFVVDNVSEYLFAKCDQESWRAEDFPNLAPPFDLMWIESVAPSHLSSDGIKKPWTGYGSWGWLLESSEATPPPDEVKQMLRHKDLYPKNGDPRWKTTATMFCSHNGIVYGPSKMQCFMVMPDGMGFGGNMIMGVIGEGSRDAAFNQPEIFPIKLAISLMNCKNVSQDVVIPSEMAARSYKKKTGRNPIEYHVLKIEPFKSTMRQAGAEKTGLKQAMHICRGHFKDYTKSGLFGKLPGIYWWHSSVRGKNSDRRIIKDYRVDAPAD